MALAHPLFALPSPIGSIPLSARPLVRGISNPVQRRGWNEAGYPKARTCRGDLLLGRTQTMRHASVYSIGQRAIQDLYSEQPWHGTYLEQTLVGEDTALMKTRFWTAIGVRWLMKQGLAPMNTNGQYPSLPREVWPALAKLEVREVSAGERSSPLAGRGGDQWRCRIWDRTEMGMWGSSGGSLS